MKYPEFERVEQLSEDYEICFLAFRAAEREGVDLLNAIRSRITAEQESDKARADELRKQSADSSRSETVRRVAAQELERLQTVEYHVTEIEWNALDEISQELSKSLSDAARIREELNDALNAARTALDGIKKKSYNKKDIPVAKQWAKNVFDQIESLKQSQRKGMQND